MVLIITVFAIVSIVWVKKNCSFSSFNEILYTLFFSIGNASREMIFDYVKYAMLSFIVCLFIVLFVYIFYKLISNNDTFLYVIIKGKKFSVNLFDNKIFRIIINWGSYVLLFITLIYALDYFYVFEYLSGIFQNSSFFEENYVNPKNVNIEFGDEKRNLIYIYLESMESTYSNVSNGGLYDKNYINELTNLANKNINFSSTNKLGGAYQVYGTSWTIGALIGSTSGIPYKLIFSDNGNNEFDNYKQFLPGAYSLGEILEDNGYNNYLIIGSDAKFGGRDIYFQEHGNYEIYDYYSAIDDNIIDSDYYVFWGYEDDILFDYAKKKLLEISKSDEPFNFTMLTVDTHFPDGYLSDFCDTDDDNMYLNSVSCSSYQVNSFIQWLKEQSFYENTTIVISGDHLSMNNYSFDDIDYDDRSIYNAFINSSVSTSCNKNRIFNNFDMMPTVLASLGANIDGNRLGLGTNLFSCESSLSELYGISYINDELNKNSIYYVKCINSNKC